MWETLKVCCILFSNGSSSLSELHGILRTSKCIRAAVDDLFSCAPACWEEREFTMIWLMWCVCHFSNNALVLPNICSQDCGLRSVLPTVLLTIGHPFVRNHWLRNHHNTFRIQDRLLNVTRGLKLVSLLEFLYTSALIVCRQIIADSNLYVYIRSYLLPLTVTCMFTYGLTCYLGGVSKWGGDIYIKTKS